MRSRLAKNDRFPGACTASSGRPSAFLPRSRREDLVLRRSAPTPGQEAQMKASLHLKCGGGSILGIKLNH